MRKYLLLCMSIFISLSFYNNTFIIKDWFESSIHLLLASTFILCLSIFLINYLDSNQKNKEINKNKDLSYFIKFLLISYAFYILTSISLSNSDFTTWNEIKILGFLELPLKEMIILLTFSITSFSIIIEYLNSTILTLRERSIYDLTKIVLLHKIVLIYFVIGFICTVIMDNDEILSMFIENVYITFIILALNLFHEYYNKSEFYKFEQEERRKLYSNQSCYTY